MPRESEDVPRGLVKLGNSIKNRRQALDITQQDLAARAGVSLTTIKDIEKHEKAWDPRESTLAKISKPLRLTARQLSDIYAELEPEIPPPVPKPKAKRKRAEDWLREISGQIRAIEERLDRIDANLGKLMPRPDVGYHSPDPQPPPPPSADS